VKPAASLLLVAATGCSLALDFEDETDLPCPCLPDHVCLVSSNRCAKKNSVEDFKSCNPDAERPDDLCQPNSICINIQEQGPRCLPKCTPSSYTTPESGLAIANQCRAGTTCWAIPEGGGVCSEGECSDLPNTCAPPQRCVLFNSAGICFTPCGIFRGTGACAGDQACHPIGSDNVTACAGTGNKQLGEVCSDREPCAKTDQSNPPRPLVCDRPTGSTDSRRCYAICQCFGAGGCSNAGCGTGETCLFSRARIDPDTQSDLGLCTPQ
jgi:hypothetical protein